MRPNPRNNVSELQDCLPPDESGKPEPNTRIERSHMSFDTQDGTSHLFLVRLRLEKSTERKQQDSKRWCGRVQRVVTGEAYEFCGWAELISYLGVMLDDPQTCNDSEGEPSRKE
jgi:hypothetical protein